MLRNLGIKWVRKDDGTVLLEFAFVAPFFALLLLGIIELGLIFTAATVLEGGTGDAARLIRTGHLQQFSTDPEADFSAELCSHVELFIPCVSLQYEVINIPDNSFSDANNAAPPVFDANGVLQVTPFDAGGPNDVILIRTYYWYPIVTPYIQAFLADDTERGEILLQSTIALLTEPYEYED